MDPDETLRLIIGHVEAIIRLDDDYQKYDGDRNKVNAEIAIHAVDLAEHQKNLNDWLSKGGFLPKTWQR